MENKIKDLHSRYYQLREEWQDEFDTHLDEVIEEYAKSGIEMNYELEEDGYSGNILYNIIITKYPDHNTKDGKLELEAFISDLTFDLSRYMLFYELYINANINQDGEN